MDHLETALNKAIKHLSKDQPKWIRVLFWTIGSLILIGLTIRDIHPLWNEYKTNNLAAHIKIVSGNRTIKPPSLSLRIPRSNVSLQRVAEYLYFARKNWSRKCDECAKLEQHSWDIWKDLDFPANWSVIAYHKLLSSAISARLLSNSDFEALSVNNSDWNQPLIESAWDLLDCVANLDANAYFGNNSTHWKYYCFGDHDVDAALREEKVKPLFDRIADILCQYIKFPKTPHLGCARHFQNQPSVVYMDALYFSLPLSANGAVIAVNSTGHKNTVWPALAQTNNPFRIVQDASMLTWPLSYLEKADILFSSETMNPWLLEAEERVYVKYLVILTVSEKRSYVNCYTESSPSVCMGKCMEYKIVRKCACVPFTFRASVDSKFARGVPYCNTRHYSECAMNETGEVNECRAKCENPCEYISYQWHISKDIIPRPGQRLFNIHVTPIVSPFVEFHVAVKDSPAQFFSQMAAVFNLYLGVSGLSAVALALLCFQLIFKSYKSRHRASDRIPNANSMRLRSHRVFETQNDRSPNASNSGVCTINLDGFNHDPRPDMSELVAFWIKKRIDVHEKMLAELKASITDLKRKKV